MAAFILSMGLIFARFKLSAQILTTLHAFAPVTGSTNSDGAYPWAQLVLCSNVLYGTTYNGGAFTNGTIFAVNVDGTGFTNLHTFSACSGLRGTNYDGAQPVAGLILVSNTLYGTTGIAGMAGHGTIYAINTDGSGFTNLHNFSGINEGLATTAPLVACSNVLYGASQGGGTNGLGTIFAIDIDGTGYTNLHNFATFNNGTNSEGAQPLAGLILSSNTLYGTCWSGGMGGKGSVFRINTDGMGFTNLHSFSALVANTNSDGATPFAGLTLRGNVLYGSTIYGGVFTNGVLFKLNTDGTGFTNFHNFTTLTNFANVDGTSPYGRLFLSGNMLFGAATGGGTGTNGTVFIVNTDGTGFRIVYHFSNLIGGTNYDGVGPVSGIFASNSLYGMTHIGGIGGSGTIFSLFILPQLAINFSGGNAVLSWPTNADGFSLQSTLDLTPSALWGPVFPLPVVVSGQYVVTNSGPTAQMFYRLVQLTISQR